MPDYSHGKIYTINCNTNIRLIYVGSTTATIKQRFQSHKTAYNSNYNMYLYSVIRENGGFDNFTISLYEDFECESRRDLTEREAEIILLIGTLNKCVPYRTEEFRKEYDKIYCKQYRQEHQEQIIKYREEHKSEISEQRKQHYITNKEYKVEKSKLYYKENKDKINLKHRTKIKLVINCLCGGKYIDYTKIRHERSKKHKTYIIELN